MVVPPVGRYTFPSVRSGLVSARSLMPCSSMRKPLDSRGACSPVVTRSETWSRRPGRPERLDEARAKSRYRSASPERAGARAGETGPAAVRQRALIFSRLPVSFWPSAECRIVTARTQRVRP